MDVTVSSNQVGMKVTVHAVPESVPSHDFSSPPRTHPPQYPHPHGPKHLYAELDEVLERQRQELRRQLDHLIRKHAGGLNALKPKAPAKESAGGAGQGAPLSKTTSQGLSSEASLQCTGGSPPNGAVMAEATDAETPNGPLLHPNLVPEPTKAEDADDLSKDSQICRMQGLWASDPSPSFGDRLGDRPCAVTNSQRSILPSHTSVSQWSQSPSREPSGKTDFRKSDSSVESEISMEDALRGNSKQVFARFDATRRLECMAKQGTNTRSKLLRVLQGWEYEMANAVLIFVNAILIAWETQYAASRVAHGLPVDSVVFEAVMYIFCALFSVDLGLQLYAQGLCFFCSADWKWNMLDITVVAGSIIEVIAFVKGGGPQWLSNASLLRVLRLVRVVRIVRAMRSLFRQFRDLRLTIAMLCDSVVPLLTFSSVLAMVFMVFGIFFTDGATQYIAKHGEDGALRLFYGGLFTSMGTLFKAVSGGLDWNDALDPLMMLAWPYPVIFYFYILFSFIALLNVVSAIFIDNTMNRSKNDRDFVVQSEIQDKREFLNTMDKLFMELDPDRSGTIRLQELQAQFMNPTVNAYFQAIDLNVSKVKKLFQLMDVNKSGDIDLKEFSQGCTRLRGEAKELDVAIVQYEIKEIGSDLQGIKSTLQSLFSFMDHKFTVMAPAFSGSWFMQQPCPPPTT